MRVRRAPGTRGRTRGQTLVEFALALPMFVLLVLGTIDLGRGVYQMNAAAQAAREIVRTTSVYPGSTLGTSAETAAVLATQRGLVPGLRVDGYLCVDIAGAAVSGPCRPGNWVRVRVTSRFDPVLPLLMAFAPIQLTSSSSAEIE